MHDGNFPLAAIKIKSKNLETPSFSKGLKKSSKTKQRPYIKFLKNKSTESEEKCKNYKNIFEKLKINKKRAAMLLCLINTNAILCNHGK